MKCPEFTLRGLRFRGEEFRRVEAKLFKRVASNVWWAILSPAIPIQVGDRLRFGETSESIACLLNRLDAEVVELSGNQALLSFDLSGPVLDDALARLGI